MDSKELTKMVGLGSRDLENMIVTPVQETGLSQYQATDDIQALTSQKTSKGKVIDAPSQSESRPEMVNNVYTEIVEQPKSGALRFRYECEGRSAGSTPGVKSTTDKKTYPTIKIHNYKGVAVVVVSCVTKDTPPRPHPHSLVGKDCKMGVCTVKVRDADLVTFPHLGIQCVKKKDVDDALRMRKEINVDPFQTGFDLKANSIDFSVVKLCFQVFLPDESGKITRIVQPVVSNPIHDKKAFKDLIICRVDRTSGKSKGGDEVFLLCEKINKDDIAVRFYQEDDNERLLWEDYGEFGTGDVHRQFAVVFKTPPYKEAYIPRPVQVKLQLKRPSDGEFSDPIMFTYMPEDPDPDRIAEKRKRKAETLEKFVNSYNSGDTYHRSQGTMIKDKVRQKIKAHRSSPKEGLPEYSFDHTGGVSDIQFNQVSINVSPSTSVINNGGNVFTSKTTSNNVESVISQPINTTASTSMPSTSLNANLNTTAPKTIDSQGLASLLETFMKNSGETQPQIFLNSGTNADFSAGGEVNLSIGSDNQQMFSISSTDLQSFLNENCGTLSFPSGELNSGNMQVDIDQNVAAVESVHTEESDQT